LRQLLNIAEQIVLIRYGVDSIYTGTGSSVDKIPTPKQEPSRQHAKQVPKPVSFILCRFVCYPLQGGLLPVSSPSCLVKVSFAGYAVLSAPSPLYVAFPRSEYYERI
jgi:hypothetical protein